MFGAKVEILLRLCSRHQFLLVVVLVSCSNSANSIFSARPRSAGGMKPRPKTIHVDGDDTDLGRATILIFLLLILLSNWDTKRPSCIPVRPSGSRLVHSWLARTFFVVNFVTFLQCCGSKSGIR